MNSTHTKEQRVQANTSTEDKDPVSSPEPENIITAGQIAATTKNKLKLVPATSPLTDNRTKKRTPTKSKRLGRTKAVKITAPPKRLEELKEDQLKAFADRNAVVNLIQQGVPVNVAIQRVGIDCTERTARNWVRRKEAQGATGLIDKRWGREPEAHIFTPEVKKLTLGWYFARPAAGYRAIWKMVCRECRRLRLPVPCETTVKDYLSNLEPALKLFRRGKPGIRVWEQAGKPVVRYESTTYANELWQGDHSPLRIWVRVMVFREWRPFAAHISVLLDAESRAVPGYVVSTKYPDAWVIALAFWRAIMPKTNRSCDICGIPTFFETDNGSDFLSEAIKATLASLGTVHVPDPPYYPNNKGKVERFFKTLDSGCLRLLPGHMDAIGSTPGAALKHVHELLTLQQLDHEIARWLDDDYHMREHSETGRAPAEHWRQTVLLNLPNSEDELNLLLLKYDLECTVLNTGIKFTLDGVKHRYWSPQVAHFWKRRVKIRYNPEDLDSVLLYCAATGDFLCEAFDMLSDTPRYSVDDVKRTRNQYRRGLIERTRQYMGAVFNNDRNATERLQIEAKKKDLIAQGVQGQADGSPSQAQSKEIRNLFDLFRRQDSGRE
jgi:putative transposase